MPLPDSMLTSSQRAALGRIHGLVEYWQITADELAPAGPRRLSAPQREALRRARALVRQWDIAAAELGGGPAAGAGPLAGAAAKYVHPLTGEHWDGRGSQPDWLRRALLQEGYYVHELRAATL
jgi:DNA-binding protein H-NS